MRSNVRSITRATMLALGMSLTLPSAAFAQQAGWWGNQQGEQRRERREERRERREERREERQERREERRGRDWDGYGNYGGNAQLRQTALNAGYNNGIKEGRKDRQRNERYNFSDETDYRNASKDYSSRLGDRSLYQRYFRAGFENGYRDGYNGY